MSGLANLALGSVPVAGGFLLAVATGQLKSPGPLKAPNYRVMIKQDQDILRDIPEDQVARRTALQHTIDVRIDDLISAIATDHSRGGRRLQGQLARLRPVSLRHFIRVYLVERAPQQDQLASHLHCLDPGGRSDRWLRHARDDENPSREAASP